MDVEFGHCHRYPPTLTIADTTLSVIEQIEEAHRVPWPFPLTFAEDWCGEYKPR
jgi:hypothetical protein